MFLGLGVLGFRDFRVEGLGFRVGLEDVFEFLLPLNSYVTLIKLKNFDLQMAPKPTLV